MRALARRRAATELPETRLARRGNQKLAKPLPLCMTFAKNPGKTGRVKRFSQTASKNPEKTSCVKFANLA
jgi:hypothetical protein